MKLVAAMARLPRRSDLAILSFISAELCCTCTASSIPACRTTLEGGEEHPLANYQGVRDALVSLALLVDEFQMEEPFLTSRSGQSMRWSSLAWERRRYHHLARRVAWPCGPWLHAYRDCQKDNAQLLQPIHLRYLQVGVNTVLTRSCAWADVIAPSSYGGLMIADVDFSKGKRLPQRAMIPARQCHTAPVPVVRTTYSAMHTMQHSLQGTQNADRQQTPGRGWMRLFALHSGQASHHPRSPIPPQTWALIMDSQGEALQRPRKCVSTRVCFPM